MIKNYFKLFFIFSCVVISMTTIETLEANACAVCYGASGSSLTAGLNMGIFTLLVILVGVLGKIASFFLDVHKKSIELNQISA